jgi:hypothetical protein
MWVRVFGYFLIREKPCQSVAKLSRNYFSTVTSVFTEFAMKHSVWAK